MVEECKSSLSIAEWACNSFAKFTSEAVMKRNTEAMAKLLDDGICECLVSTMNTHVASSLEVAIKGCQALNDLSWTSRELREFLGELGACECVVFALTMHIGNPEVSEYGTSTIINLSKDNISNSFRLASCGACEVIVQTGNFGFNLRHPKCTIVAANVCNAIYNLCEAVNQPKLAECGACEFVSSLLKFHMETYDVAVAATRSICGLASLTVDNREVLGKVGACRLIVSAMNHHPEALPILEHCCEAVMHLSLSPNNTKHLLAASACDAVYRALNIHLMEVEFGAEICCGAMLNLVTYGTAAKENCVQLYKLGAPLLMERVQVSTHASHRARENAQQLLQSFITHGLMRAPSSRASSSKYPAGTGTGAAGGNMHTTKSAPVLVHGSEAKAGTIPLQAELRHQQSLPASGSLSINGLGYDELDLDTSHEDRLLLARTSSAELQQGIFEI